MSATDAAQEISVTLPGVKEGDVFADRVRGREALSAAYDFEVDVISGRVLNIRDMIGQAATLKISVLEETAVVKGVVLKAASLDPTQNRQFCYRFTIGPSLALMRFSAQNQVYGTDRDMTVIDIIENELKDAVKASSRTGGNRADRRIGYRMLAGGDYPKLDFVMQYRENDFDFISRLCEKFGIFYAFDHDGSREEVLFCDRNVHFRQVSGQTLSSELPYRHRSMSVGEGGFAIRAFNSSYEASTGRVELREYYELTPNVDLGVSSKAALSGQGMTVLYGENYRTTDEGQSLARVRAKQLAAEQIVFHGESNIPLLRPGFFFKLIDHPDSAFERLYVITDVEHRITEPTPLGFTSHDKTAEPYSNRFTCIPFDVPYRPTLSTRKPVVDGVLIAFIDGEKNATKAQIDEYGRYRVRIVDEESGLSGGKASHLVRKAEAYGGGDQCGSHSTLLVGTEVLLAFINGDPDRPIILGALSNAEKTNPVVDTNANAAQRTRTSTGIVFELYDGGA
ncbi:type VI secretion system tip protein TssI/VgrG [Rhizobium calliandrae]|uniref:Type VI secretion system tip protein TssI/VgrG n=1 Tax=Rhizobium calliandrae TaxID=1312182 RepID=A0ABT7KNQ6_9HYPH|nr:type VI secretion system tip protein TssI/VgrG [Rhizobium calliandrae]MDL2408874.1 type VI secretion system tip protein TssI/VgrG [Rhizobium calliandrae]